MKTISAIIAASVLFGSAAYAQNITVNLVPPPPKPETENVTVQVNPMDYSDINQSPIRGEGRIRVVHNEPDPAAADKAAEIHKARWLLQDAGYQCSMPRRR